MGDQKVAEHSGAEQKIEAAFEALRCGDATPSADLIKLGPAIVTWVGAYVTDPSEDVRRQAVAIIGAFNVDTAPPFLTRALADSSGEIRQLATRALYERYEPATLTKRHDLGAALQGVARHDASALALLLLAYFPGAETRHTLRAIPQNDPVQVKFAPWSRPVSRALPALIAGSRLGVNDMRIALLSRIEAAPDEELHFMLLALREIDAPEVLHALSRRALANLDEISADGGAGIPSGVLPRRRLCDLAVDTLIQRLQLHPSFPLNGARRYEQPEIDEVTRLIRASVPQ